MNEPNYHADFIAEHDVVHTMPVEAVHTLRIAWGVHHDDYAPDEKKFLTPEFQGGNRVTVQAISKLSGLCLQAAQHDMDRLAFD